MSYNTNTKLQQVFISHIRTNLVNGNDAKWGPLGDLYIQLYNILLEHVILLLIKILIIY